MHICFIASTVDCFRTGEDNLYKFADELDAGLHKLNKNLKTHDTDMVGKAARIYGPNFPKSSLLVSISSTLAILAMPIILRCLYHRLKHIV